MKRIEFIAPVEAVRGNLSGRQDLRYALNNNKAFESPQGSINYARNYTPRYVGAKLARNGAKIFSVRTKNAVNMSAKAVKAMALLGGVGAIVGSLLAHKSGTPYQNMYALWQYALTHGSEGVTFRKYASDFIRPFLESKAQNITATIASITVNFKNPWYDGSQTTGATISSKVLVQFWKQLSPNATTYTINGKKGISKTGYDFTVIVANAELNVLNLTTESHDGDQYVKYLGEYVVDLSGDAITADHQILDLEEFKTTPIAPW